MAIAFVSMVIRFFFVLNIDNIIDVCFGNVVYRAIAKNLAR